MAPAQQGYIIILHKKDANSQKTHLKNGDINSLELCNTPCAQGIIYLTSACIGSIHSSCVECVLVESFQIEERIHVFNVYFHDLNLLTCGISIHIYTKCEGKTVYRSRKAIWISVEKNLKSKNAITI